MIWGAYTYAEADTPGFSHFLLGEAAAVPTAVTRVGLNTRGVTSAVGTVMALGLVLVAGMGFAVRKLRQR
jgi:hypothetical protein